MNRNRPSDITVRMATPRDAKEIVAIYARYVQSTAISFEYEVPSVSEFTRRITKTLDQYPWLVCVHHGSIVGYACAHQFCARSAYQWNAELTIYMDQFHTGNGIGSLLYRTLFTILKEQ
ncbi:MAG: GNAT family N-acetyltransferase, partial [Thermoguttaceae bacterium]|nr:GNAT family N-acetyltransferase [Thermoguttaceae bacterium]